MNPLNQKLAAQKQYLSDVLEALQRCVFFLEASVEAIAWPLASERLEAEKKNVALFESLSAINERFAKLQDTLGAGMRHSTVLAGEPNESFLKVLSFFEKKGVLDSIENWQICRTTRNLGAHIYDINYKSVADHFNGIYGLRVFLYQTTDSFLKYCEKELHATPSSSDFVAEFNKVIETVGKGETKITTAEEHRF